MQGCGVAYDVFRYWMLFGVSGELYSRACQGFSFLLWLLLPCCRRLGTPPFRRKRKRHVALIFPFIVRLFVVVDASPLRHAFKCSK